MIDLPKLALSVRQPWAWAIIHGGKDVENRDWSLSNPGLHFRGRAAIHASKGMTREEYEDAAEFMIMQFGIACPPPAALLRGGIIGSVEVVKDVSVGHTSDWFFGPRALVLRDPRPCDFILSVGALGFFEWKRDYTGVAPPPAKWMLAAQKS